MLSQGLERAGHQDGVLEELSEGLRKLRTANMFTLNVEHVTKIYKKRKVVDNVSLHVDQGEIVGVLRQTLCPGQQKAVQQRR